MDIKIKADDVSFHFRSRGLIEQDGKFLVARCDDVPYYHIPGGHVEIGEDTKQAICRELKEEIGCGEVTVKNLFCANEVFYVHNNKKFHSVELYYLIKPQNKISIKANLENLAFKWVTKKELESIDLKPEPVKQLIAENDVNSVFRHLISRE
jgi:ADP-ribose pyrophosphatase YjhB (NUDIX family)